MNKGYPFNLVDKPNESLKEYGKKLKIYCDEDGYYSIDILTIDSNGNVTDVSTFAENYFEEELEECVHDACLHVKTNEEFKAKHPEYICYRRINGWTHEMPALLYSLTDIPIFFYDKEAHTVENIDNHAGIDAYEDRKGFFCCLPDDYDLALRQFTDHEERSAER